MEVLLYFVKVYLEIIVPLHYLIFLQQLKDRLTSSGQMRNKSGNIIQSSQETSDFLLSTGSGNLLNSFDFGRINLNAFVADNET